MFPAMLLFIFSAAVIFTSWRGWVMIWPRRALPSDPSSTSRPGLRGRLFCPPTTSSWLWAAPRLSSCSHSMFHPLPSSSSVQGLSPILLSQISSHSLSGSFKGMYLHPPPNPAHSLSSYRYLLPFANTHLKARFNPSTYNTLGSIPQENENSDHN